MIAEYGWSIVIAVYLVWTLGVTALLIALFYIAAFALRLWMEVRGVYGDYIEYHREKRRLKVHPGEIKNELFGQKEDD